MAVENPPVSPLETNQGEPGFDLRETLSFAWRQWKFTVGVMAISMLAGTIYLLHQTPLYTASSQVLLDRTRDRPPGGDAILADPTFDAAMIESQIAVIGSTVLLRR